MPAADRTIYADAAAIDRISSKLSGIRAELAATRLTLPAAEARLDHSDDLLRVVISQLSSAANDVAQAIDHVEAGEAEYARVHGLFALAANDNHGATPPEAPATLAEMTKHYEDSAVAYAVTLRGGVP